MVSALFHNTTLIVAFLFLAIRLRKYLYQKVNPKVTALLYSFLAGIPSILIMTAPFIIDGMIFDLRSVC